MFFSSHMSISFVVLKFDNFSGEFYHNDVPVVAAERPKGASSNIIRI